MRSNTSNSVNDDTSPTHMKSLLNNIKPDKSVEFSIDGSIKAQLPPIRPLSAIKKSEFSLLTRV